jgi:alpha-tubulin suppressor-like RCC1 family protein
MSTLLWKYYFENDVDSFRQVLARATFNASAQTRGGKGGHTGNTITGVAGSPGPGLSTSPTLSKSAKASSHNSTPKLSNVTLSRADINWRDSHGVTLLHHIASSTIESASDFAIALLQLPLLDLYVQDEESGWTALHRALYFGNTTIARALMDRDTRDAYEHSNITTSHGAGGLIKIKDREGNSPFDVYGASITSRNIRHGSDIPLLGGGPDDEEDDIAQGVTGDAEDDDRPGRAVAPGIDIGGDQVFAFGSNKNFTLGFGDEDDRQFPERIYLKRPEFLLRRFYNEFETHSSLAKRPESSEVRGSPVQINQLPAAVQYRPIVIQDVQLSKLHSAVLTTDPEANLYMCGFGSGGRLGTGDETTRFGFINIHSGGLLGKKINHVGLGQNHTIAISSEGETFTWGSNGYGQLGYAPSASLVKEEEPVQLLPKQVFGPLKRELVIGAAASRIHSVVHTLSSLYTFGKNDGQLGLVDSDARSLAVQNIPRKVAASLFSSSIKAVSAIDKATTCLLDNHDVWVFSNYGYTKMSFPLEGFSNHFVKSVWRPRSQSTESYVCKITSGGDTICAMSRTGDVFTVHVSQKVESSTATASTTNPAKIRGALSTPQRVWSLKKDHMAVRDVDVGQDGSIIICTESGSVWRRVKRAKIKDATAAGLSEYKAKDYKFSRVPGLTRIAAVRSNTFGAYAAVRRDFDVLKTQVDVEGHTLWKDLYSLVPFRGFGDEDSDTENPAPRFWTSSQRDDIATIRRAVLTASNLEEQVADFLTDREGPESTYNVRLGTTLSDVRIPVHDFMLGARSETLRQALATFRQAYFFTIPEVLNIEYDSDGKTFILFQGVDLITIFNLALYIYTDSVIDVWHHTRHVPASAFRYRQIRTELMKIASHLNMPKLEQAVRVMTAPPKTLNKDLERAIIESGYFDSGDVRVDLDGESVKVHSALMVQRCPFFEVLFQGRAAGMWLSSRREQMQEHQDAISVDLKHVDLEIFKYVLQYLYADTGEEMFDDVVTTNIDAFLDLVMAVMSVANELMLDRLAQCCQKMLGRFGTIYALSLCCSIADFNSQYAQCLSATQCRRTVFGDSIQRRCTRIHLSQPRGHARESVSTSDLALLRLLSNRA